MRTDLIDELVIAISAIEQQFKIAQQELMAAGARLRAFDEAARELIHGWDNCGGEMWLPDYCGPAVDKLRSLLEGK